MPVRQTRPPGRGDCWILKIAHAPSPKNLSKNGFCPRKGVAFLWKAFLQKNFWCRKRFRCRVIQRKLHHGVHPVLQWCASNAVVTRDPAGGRKFDKAKSTGRIDALVALAMALSLTLLWQCNTISDSANSSVCVGWALADPRLTSVCALASVRFTPYEVLATTLNGEDLVRVGRD
jgi:hypothetical protein